jgi:hypothetical protein
MHPVRRQWLDTQTQGVWKMSFNKREVTTILAALRYLQANRDDAIEAMADFDDAAGTETKPYLLTEGEIDTLCERINMDEEDHEKMITLFIPSVKGKIKGLLTAKDLVKNIGNAWWDALTSIEVPLKDFNDGKVIVDTIKNYL